MLSYDLVIDKISFCFCHVSCLQFVLSPKEVTVLHIKYNTTEVVVICLFTFKRIIAPYFKLVKTIKMMYRKLNS